MNGEHLSPKTRELLDKPIEERIAHIQKDSWIPYSQANKILQQLEDLLQHPKCDRMLCAKQTSIWGSLGTLVL
jgi:hypothetical protein